MALSAARPPACPIRPPHCSEVNLYIPVPGGTKGKELFVVIATTHLHLGIRGNPPYLDVRRRELGGVVV